MTSAPAAAEHRRSPRVGVNIRGMVLSKAPGGVVRSTKLTSRSATVANASLDGLGLMVAIAEGVEALRPSDEVSVVLSNAPQTLVVRGRVSWTRVVPGKGLSVGVLLRFDTKDYVLRRTYNGWIGDLQKTVIPRTLA